MKLTASQIQFIDTYLQNSDVIFVDIRAEMTDHIASAIEEKMQIENIDFDDAFKMYMIQNKRNILAQNNHFFSHYYLAILNFIKSFYLPYNLILAVFVYLIFYFGLPFLNRETTFIIIKKCLFFSILIFGFAQGFYSFFVIKKRYLYLEKTGFILLIIYHFNLLTNGFYSEKTVSVNLLCISVFLYVSFVIHYIKTIKKFKKLAF